MMEKMENIVFDRNYEEDEPDPLAQAIFDRVNAPGGFLEEFSKKMDAIPKVIVPKDKENYIGVFLNVRLVDGTGNAHMTGLQMPADDDLYGQFAMGRSDLLHFRKLQEGVGVSSSA